MNEMVRDFCILIVIGCELQALDFVGIAFDLKQCLRASSENKWQIPT